MWIRDDPVRQHGNARSLRACIWAGLWHCRAIFFGISGTCLSSFVLSIERLTLLLQLTQALFVTRRRHHEVVDCRLALQAICSVVVIPTSPSSPCATSSSELSEISPHSLLETRTILLDIYPHRAICADLTTKQDATCGVRHAGHQDRIVLAVGHLDQVDCGLVEFTENAAQ